jgi:hypothetical protein
LAEQCLWPRKVKPHQIHIFHEWIPEPNASRTRAQPEKEIKRRSKSLPGDAFANIASGQSEENRLASHGEFPTGNFSRGISDLALAIVN